MAFKTVLISAADARKLQLTPEQRMSAAVEKELAAIDESIRRAATGKLQYTRRETDVSDQVLIRVRDALIEAGYFVRITDLDNGFYYILIRWNDVKETDTQS